MKTNIILSNTSTSRGTKGIPLGILLVLTLSLFSCLSDKFLLENLSKNERSNILTEKGIEKYQDFFSDSQDISNLENLKKYFETALQYNPENTKAKDYLKRLDRYKELKAKELLRYALQYKNISKRSEQNDFNMCYYIQKALEIDPQSKEAQSFKNEIKDTYSKLVALYSDRGLNAKDDAQKESNDAKKKRLIAIAMDNFNKVVLLDKNNVKISNERNSIESAIKKDIQNLITQSYENISKYNFTAAREKLYFIKENNKSLSEKMDSEISGLEYTLNYKWAVYYYNTKKMDLASNRIYSALNIKRTNEALNLNKIIQGKRSKEVFSGSFDTTLESIDDLINEDQLIYAKQRIDYLYKGANPSQQKMLDAKTAILISKLESIYEEAVKDYNNENFKAAIQKFKTIIAVDAGFKEAQKYYEKSTEKQKTLESF